MRLLITTHGGAGHLHPLLPIAAAAASAGHDVAFAVEPPADEVVRRSGFETFAMGMTFDFGDPEAAFPELGRRTGLDGAMWAMEHVFYGALARAAVPDVERIMAAWSPDVVLHESSEVAGLLVAERAGVPHVAFNYGGMDLHVLQFVAGTAWGRLRSTLGLAPDPELAVLAESPMIALMPTCWADGDQPAEVCRVRLPDDTVRGAGRWQAPTDLTVYATLGTVNRDVAALADLASALERSGVRSLVTTGLVDPSVLGSVGARVELASYVPQGEVLGDVDLVVHHAGFNTMLGALRHGLPQVLLPMDADQPLNAHRAGELGFAAVVAPEDRTPTAIAAAIDEVLADPRYADRARAVRSQIDALPSVDAAVADLEHRASGSPRSSTA